VTTHFGLSYVLVALAADLAFGLWRATPARAEKGVSEVLAPMRSEFGTLTAGKLCWLPVAGRDGGGASDFGALAKPCLSSHWQTTTPSVKA